MANAKNLIGKVWLTMLDGLLLALCAAALTYLSMPLVLKLSKALGDAAEPNKHADIQAVGVLVFLGVFLFGISAVFLACFVAEYNLFALMPVRARLFARLGLLMVFLPVFIQTARRGPGGYFDWFINPSIRKNEAQQKAKNELARKLKVSGALTVEREPDGIMVANNTDQLVRVQVAFITRSDAQIFYCYPGQSATLPPSPSDEEMSLPPRGARRYLFREAHTNTGSRRQCGFDDYAVWGWDEKSVPLFLSEKAQLY